jgi:hypothetical protein
VSEEPRSQNTWFIGWKDARTIEVFIVILCLFFLCWKLNSVLFFGTATFSHDNYYWHLPLASNFFESWPENGIVLWNPYSHGGESFLIPLLQLRLFDPTTIVLAVLGDWFSIDPVLLASWDRFTKIAVGGIGTHILVRQWSASTVVRLSLPIVIFTSALTYSSFWQGGIADTYYLSPFVGIFSYRLFWKSDYRVGNWAGLGLFIGISLQSYHFTGALIFVGVFLFAKWLSREKNYDNRPRRKGVGTGLCISASLVLFMGGLNAYILFAGDYIAVARSDFSPQAEHDDKDGNPATYKVRQLKAESWNLGGELQKRTGASSKPIDLLSLGARGGIFDHTSEASQFIGPLTFLVALYGLIVVRCREKIIWTLTLFVFTALAMGKFFGVYELLYSGLPVLWGLRHTQNLINYALLAWIFFFIIGSEEIISKYHAWQNRLSPSVQKTRKTALRMIYSFWESLDRWNKFGALGMCGIVIGVGYWITLTDDSQLSSRTGIFAIVLMIVGLSVLLSQAMSKRRVDRHTLFVLAAIGYFALVAFFSVETSDALFGLIVGVGVPIALVVWLLKNLAIISHVLASKGKPRRTPEPDTDYGNAASDVTFLALLFLWPLFTKYAFSPFWNDFCLLSGVTLVILRMLIGPHLSSSGKVENKSVTYFKKIVTVTILLPFGILYELLYEFVLVSDFFIGKLVGCLIIYWYSIIWLLSLRIAEIVVGASNGRIRANGGQAVTLLLILWCGLIVSGEIGIAQLRLRLLLQGAFFGFSLLTIACYLTGLEGINDKGRQVDSKIGRSGLLLSALLVAQITYALYANRELIGLSTVLDRTEESIIYFGGAIGMSCSLFAALVTMGRSARIDGWTSRLTSYGGAKMMKVIAGPLFQQHSKGLLRIGTILTIGALVIPTQFIFQDKFRYVWAFERDSSLFDRQGVFNRSESRRGFIQLPNESIQKFPQEPRYPEVYLKQRVAGDIPTHDSATAEKNGEQSLEAPGLADPSKQLGLLRNSNLWNSFFVTKEYQRLISSNLADRELAKIFAVGKPIVQYRCGATVVVDPIAWMEDHTSDELSSFLEKNLVLESGERGTSLIQTCDSIQSHEDYPVIRIASANRNEINLIIENARPGYLYVADAYQDNWSAKSDDRSLPIYKANGLFKAIPVDSDVQNLTLTYKPLILNLLLISFFSSGILGFALMLEIFVRRPVSPVKPRSKNNPISQNLLL